MHLINLGSSEIVNTLIETNDEYVASALEKEHVNQLGSIENGGTLENLRTAKI